jgi:hypothetical protein
MDSNAKFIENQHFINNKENVDIINVNKKDDYLMSELKQQK